MPSMYACFFFLAEYLAAFAVLLFGVPICLPPVLYPFAIVCFSLY